MITKTKLVKRIFSSLLTAALAVPMTALTAHATGEAFFYPPKNPVMTDQQFEVSVTFSADSERGSVHANIAYDDSVIEFESSDNASGGGGVLTVNGFPDTPSSEVDFSFTFKGLSAGNANISLQSCQIYSPDSELIGSPTAYCEITVERDKKHTKTETSTTPPTDMSTTTTIKKTKTAQPNCNPSKVSLTALTVDNGELSPAFAYNVYNYTVNVDNSVTNVEIEGTTASPSDYIWYTGTSECQVGENVRTITVTDVDGNAATYTVTIIRAAGGDEQQTQTSQKKDGSDTSSAVSKNANVMDQYKKMLNTALAIVLIVLVIALVVIIIWIRGKIKGGKKDK